MRKFNIAKKPIKIPQEMITSTIYIKDNYYGTVQDLINAVPKGVDYNKVYLDLSIESGYYGSESAKLDIYYQEQILNPNYEVELKEYKHVLAVEKYYNKHHKDYFKDGDVIELPIGHICFLDNLELAPLKKEISVDLISVSMIQSPDIGPTTNTHWCQYVYFNHGGKLMNTVLYSQDVLLRKKAIDFLSSND